MKKRTSTTPPPEIPVRATCPTCLGRIFSGSCTRSGCPDRRPPALPSQRQLARRQALVNELRSELRIREDELARELGTGAGHDCYGDSR